MEQARHDSPLASIQPKPHRVILEKRRAKRPLPQRESLVQDPFSAYTKHAAFYTRDATTMATDRTMRLITVSQVIIFIMGPLV